MVSIYDVVYVLMSQIVILKRIYLVRKFMFLHSCRHKHGIMLTFPHCTLWYSFYAVWIEWDWNGI